MNIDSDDRNEIQHLNLKQSEQSDQHQDNEITSPHFNFSPLKFSKEKDDKNVCIEEIEENFDFDEDS